MHPKFKIENLNHLLNALEKSQGLEQFVLDCMKDSKNGYYNPSSRIESLSAMVEKNNTLTSLSLHYTQILSSKGDELLNALTTNSTLKSLSIKEEWGGGKMSIFNNQTLKNFLSNTHLKSIIFEREFFYNLDMCLFFNFLSHNTSLTSLTIKKWELNFDNTKFLEGLVKNNTLTSLSIINDRNHSTSGLDNMFKILEHYELQYLILQGFLNYRYKVIDLTPFIKYLANNFNLRSIDLSNNNFKNDDGINIFAALKDKTNLTCLDFRGNNTKLDDKFEDFLLNNKTIQKIYLGGNIINYAQLLRAKYPNQVEIDTGDVIISHRIGKKLYKLDLTEHNYDHTALSRALKGAKSFKDINSITLYEDLLKEHYEILLELIKGNGNIIEVNFKVKFTSNTYTDKDQSIEKIKKGVNKNLNYKSMLFSFLKDKFSEGTLDDIKLNLNECYLIRKTEKINLPSELSTNKFEFFKKENFFLLTGVCKIFAIQLEDSKTIEIPLDILVYITRFLKFSDIKELSPIEIAQRSMASKNEYYQIAEVSNNKMEKIFPLSTYNSKHEYDIIKFFCSTNRCEEEETSSTELEKTPIGSPKDAETTNNDDEVIDPEYEEAFLRLLELGPNKDEFTMHETLLSTYVSGDNIENSYE